MNDSARKTEPAVRIGAARYAGSRWKDRPASGTFAAPSGRRDDGFRDAVMALSREDEEIRLPDERGPIMFKDGLFQIDIEHADGADSIDPALKGLIDSILNP